MADTIEQLLTLGAVTPDQVQRAATIPPHVATSRLGRLIAAGAEPTALLEAVAAFSGVPVASAQSLNWASAVHLLPSTAHQLQDLVACPVQRDPQGTLHVVVADPEAVPALEALLVGFKCTLAPEARVRALLSTLYGLHPPLPPGDLADAIDVDMESSRRHALAPGPPSTPSAAAALPRIDVNEPTQPLPVAPAAPPPSDPLAPRPSGSFKRPRDEDETMRVPRAPRVPTSPGRAPSPAPAMAVLDDRTEEEGKAPSALVAAMKESERGAFLRGVVVGAGVTALLAMLAIAALLLR